MLTQAGVGRTGASIAITLATPSAAVPLTKAELRAQHPAAPTTAAVRPDTPGTLVSLERLFASNDFAAEPLGRPRWHADGSGYIKLEAPAGEAPGRDLVRYDTATGRRTVLVRGARLVPPRDSVPLDVEDYAWLVRPPDHATVRTVIANAQLRAAVAALRSRPRRALPGGGTAWRRAGRLDDDAARCRPGSVLPDAVLSIRRAGSLDSGRSVGRNQVPLAPDAHPAGLCGREPRQPRNARATGVSLAEVDPRHGWSAQLRRPNRSGRRAALAPPVPRFATRRRVGWSDGGSMTLNLMFRAPAVYRVGMAVAPVRDQRYYDTIYQARYMGLLQENANGYR